MVLTNVSAFCAFTPQICDLFTRTGIELTTLMLHIIAGFEVTTGPPGRPALESGKNKYPRPCAECAIPMQGAPPRRESEHLTVFVRGSKLQAHCRVTYIEQRKDQQKRDDSSRSFGVQAVVDTNRIVTTPCRPLWCSSWLRTAMSRYSKGIIDPSPLSWRETLSNSK